MTQQFAPWKRVLFDKLLKAGVIQKDAPIDEVIVEKLHPIPSDYNLPEFYIVREWCTPYVLGLIDESNMAVQQILTPHIAGIMFAIENAHWMLLVAPTSTEYGDTKTFALQAAFARADFRINSPYIKVMVES